MPISFQGRTDLPAGLVSLAQHQDSAITTRQTRAFLDPDQLTRAVSSGHLVRLWQGSYALAASAGDLRTRLAAADLTLGIPAVACTITAAELHGFSLSGDPRLHLLAPGGCACRSSQLVLHRDRILTPLVRVGDRMAVAPAETAVSVAAREVDRPRALGVLDAALRTSAITKEALKDVAALSRINNIRRVRELIDWADPRAESPPESWLRWVVLDAGLPPPTPQFYVRVGSGQCFRLDLAWPERKVACEYDGVAFHTGSRLFADRARMNALRGAGWMVVFATAPDLFASRDRLVADLRNNLAHRAA